MQCEQHIPTCCERERQKLKFIMSQCVYVAFFRFNRNKKFSKEITLWLEKRCENMKKFMMRRNKRFPLNHV